jgi:hypothetical protein
MPLDEQDFYELRRLASAAEDIAGALGRIADSIAGPEGGSSVYDLLVGISKKLGADVHPERKADE